MDVDAILAKARSGAAPSDWNVWPLRRGYVRTAALKWGLLSIVGFVLLVPVVMTTYPSDFVGVDAAHQSIATIIILLVALLAFGGLALTITEIGRLTHADQYWVIITPDMFIKAQPRNGIDIPLEDIADVTLKGFSRPGYAPPTTDMQNLQAGVLGRQISRLDTLGSMYGSLLGPGRGAKSLAFRDKRNNKIITIATDDAFDNLAALDQILRERVSQKEEIIWRSSLPSRQSRTDS